MTSPEITLVELTDAHKGDMQALTRDPGIMKTVCRGEAWSAEKLDQFYVYLNEERTQDNQVRTHHYWGICVAGSESVVGCVGFHPSPFHKSDGTNATLYDTIFVNRGASMNGVASAAMVLAIAEIKRRRPRCVLGAHIKKGNSASGKMHRAVGYWKEKEFSYGGKTYYVFLRSLDAF